MVGSRRTPAAAAAAILAAIAGAPALAGTDWTTFGFDNQRTGYNPHEAAIDTGNVGKLRRLWATDIGGPILTQPTVATGVKTRDSVRDLVYAGTLSGTAISRPSTG